MTPTYDVLIPGNYFCDLIFTGFPQFPELGTEVYTDGLKVTVGGVLNTVIALQRLNVNGGGWGHRAPISLASLRWILSEKRGLICRWSPIAPTRSSG